MINVSRTGIITNGQIASIESKFAGYKEELETSIVSKVEGDRERVNLLNENVKSYIPSFEENDIGNFAIIGGKLYYLGDDELSKKVAKNQKMGVIDDNKSVSEFAQEVEKKALDSVIKSRGKSAFKYTENKNGKSEEYIGGIPLYDKNNENKDKWNVVTEVESNKLKKTYGTGWYYVPKNTEIEGLGKAKKNYIINYDTNEEIEFNKQKHTLMGFDKTMAVKDHILVNIDPSIVESVASSKESSSELTVEDVFGKGVKIHGYVKNGVGESTGDNQDLSLAFGKTSFKFDGVDDYMIYPFSIDNPDISTGGSDKASDIFDGGLTFEFYGVLGSERFTLQ